MLFTRLVLRFYTIIYLKTKWKVLFYYDLFWRRHVVRVCPADRLTDSVFFCLADCVNYCKRHRPDLYFFFAHVTGTDTDQVSLRDCTVLCGCTKDRQMQIIPDKMEKRRVGTDLWATSACHEIRKEGMNPYWKLTQEVNAVTESNQNVICWKFVPQMCAIGCVLFDYFNSACSTNIIKYPTEILSF